jgi:hypothetical protein
MKMVKVEKMKMAKVKSKGKVEVKENIKSKRDKKINKSTKNII